jgi:hypothetical protein
MINFSQIYEGWKNKLVPSSDMKVLISDVSAERLSLCSKCPHHSKFHTTPLRFDDHCTLCGCTLSAKTACLSCECPAEGEEKLWFAVVPSAEEEDALKKGI